MKRKLWWLGNLVVALCGVGLVAMIAFAPDPRIRWTAIFVATILLAMLSVDVVGAWLKSKRLRRDKKSGKLNFLIVCENPKKIGCPSVADAVSDYLALLLVDTKSKCVFCSLEAAKQKIEDNLKGPKNDRYDLVFVDTSSSTNRVAYELSSSASGPLVVFVGPNTAPGKVEIRAGLHFSGELFLKNRKVFQDDLKKLLVRLDFLPQEKEKD